MSDKRFPIPIKFAQNLLVILLFCAGLFIRLYDLTDLPMDFHPTRQYHSAIIARGLYEMWGGEYPQEQIPLIRAQRVSEAIIEPPIFEYLTAVTYLLFKTDALWIPRLYAIFFWLAGGVPLFLWVRKHLGFIGGIAALGFFLFVPYGIYASRSFQPDPLMLTLCIWSLWAMDRWQEKPDWKRALIAGLWMGAAILVKQVMIFFLPTALFFLVWSSQGFKQMIRSPQVWLIGVMAILPVAIYNIYGVFVSGTLTGQYSERFFPQLWIDPGFYIRWSNMIQETVSLSIFLLSLIGIFLLPRSPMKKMMVGYGTGYILYGLILSHHISTHNYYQLPIFPLVALGFGNIARILWNEISRMDNKRFAAFGFTAILSISILLCLWEARSALKKDNYRGEAAFLSQLTNDMGGVEVKTIGLLDDYGAALNYYGFILPTYWDSEENGVNITSMNAQQTADLVAKRLKGKKYFLLSEFKTLESQPLVLEYLNSHYPIFYEDDRYIIYDLKNPLEHIGQIRSFSDQLTSNSSGVYSLCW